MFDAECLFGSRLSRFHCLQDALREKEEHIEQLLKERDLEQTEIARVTAQMEETEAKLDSLKGSDVPTPQLKMFDNPSINLPDRITH